MNIFLFNVFHPKPYHLTLINYHGKYQIHPDKDIPQQQEKINTVKHMFCIFSTSKKLCSRSYIQLFLLHSERGMKMAKRLYPKEEKNPQEHDLPYIYARCITQERPATSNPQPLSAVYPSSDSENAFLKRKVEVLESRIKSLELQLKEKPSHNIIDLLRTISELETELEQKDNKIKSLKHQVSSLKRSNKFPDANLLLKEQSQPEADSGRQGDSQVNLLESRTLFFNLLLDIIPTLPITKKQEIPWKEAIPLIEQNPITKTYLTQANKTLTPVNIKRWYATALLYRNIKTIQTKQENPTPTTIATQLVIDFQKETLFYCKVYPHIKSLDKITPALIERLFQG